MARSARLALAILALAVSLAVGLLQSGAALATPPSKSPTVSHVYDGPTYTSPTNHNAPERGPPVKSNDHAATPAVDDQSHGALARPEVVASHDYTTYDLPASFAHIDNGMGLIRRSAGSIHVEHSLLEATGVAANAVPTRLARVVPEEFGGAPTLGRPGTPDVFVTAADDLAGISTSSGIAERLTLLNPGRKPISGPFRVLEFDTPAGIASPIRRTNPGFIGGGRTAGGAREFVIPNYSTDSLANLTMRTVN